MTDGWLALVFALLAVITWRDPRKLLPTAMDELRANQYSWAWTLFPPIASIILAILSIRFFVEFLVG